MHTYLNWGFFSSSPEAQICIWKSLFWRWSEQHKWGACAESRNGGKVTDRKLMSTLLTGCLVLFPLGTQPKWSTGKENRFLVQVQIFTGRELYPGSLNPSFIKGQLLSFVPGSPLPNTAAGAWDRKLSVCIEAVPHRSQRPPWSGHQVSSKAELKGAMVGYITTGCCHCHSFPGRLSLSLDKSFWS